MWRPEDVAAQHGQPAPDSRYTEENEKERFIEGKMICRGMGSCFFHRSFAFFLNLFLPVCREPGTEHSCIF